MLRTFCQIGSIVVAFVSAVVLSRGNMMLTPDSIAELQYSHAGYHPEMIQNLCSQYADNRIVITLLCVSIILQFIGMWPDSGKNGKHFIIAAITLVIGGGLFWTISEKISERIQKDMREKVERLIKGKQES